MDESINGHQDHPSDDPSKEDHRRCLETDDKSNCKKRRRKIKSSIEHGAPNLSSPFQRFGPQAQAALAELHQTTEKSRRQQGLKTLC